MLQCIHQPTSVMEVLQMSNSIDRSIRSAELSLQMEGFSVSPICKDLCRKLLSGEITLVQYLARVMPDRKKD